MKRFICVLLSLFLLSASLVGCATTSASDPNYMAYLASIKPTVDLQLSPDGRLTGITMYPAPSPYIRQPNEWARVVEKLVGVVGMVGSIWVAGSAVVDLADAVGKNSGHNTTYGAGDFQGSMSGDGIGQSIINMPNNSINNPAPVGP